MLADPVQQRLQPVGVARREILQHVAENLGLRARMADAEAGSVEALYELGVTFSTGRGGIAVDLIEAHKWFNLAALSADTRSQACRAEISIEMTAREIAEAQRQARSWLGHTGHNRYAA